MGWCPVGPVGSIYMPRPSGELTSRRAVEHELELRARTDGSPLADAHRLVGCKLDSRPSGRRIELPSDSVLSEEEHVRIFCLDTLWEHFDETEPLPLPRDPRREPPAHARRVTRRAGLVR